MIIRCRAYHLRHRCEDRGVAFCDAWACIVAADGDWIDVDTSHPAYPHPWCGPGCQLSRMLAWFGVEASHVCKCKEHARQMDSWGADECLRRIDEILGWLEVAARQANMPFQRDVARAAVMVAVEAGRRPSVAP